MRRSNLSDVPRTRRALRGTPSQEELTSRLRYLTGISPEPKRVEVDELGETELVDPASVHNSSAAGNESRRIALPFRLVHVLVVIICVVLAVGYSVFAAANSRTEIIEAEVPTASFSMTTPEPTPEVLMRIHVLGGVAKPGVVSLPQGARVIDAIEEAGGLTPDAALGELNLAAVLDDGVQVVVGVVGGLSSEVRVMLTASAPGVAGSKLNLNQASVDQLESLPGIGPVMANRIVERRSQRPFASVEELQEIDGIGPKSYAELVNLVRV